MSGGLPDVVALTRQLLALDTVDRAESTAVAVLAPLLDAAGFSTRTVELAPGRAQLIAEWQPAAPTAPPLCFSGHLDTVPLGGAAWTHDPFAGETDGDRLHGRGSSDMKGGVAALVLAAARLAGGPRPKRAGLRLVLTAGEETGCRGAATLADTLRGAPSGPLLIAEPTANRPVHGHKGALWLEADATGVTAHGSRPDLGDNAVLRLARAVLALTDEGDPDPTPPHPVMGAPTLNVGTFAGGLNTNSVPDRATATLDLRTVAGQRHPSVRDAVSRRLGTDIAVRTLLDLPAVWTDPDDPWVRSVTTTTTTITGTPPPPPGAATFFTDACLLTPALGDVPTLILGPGEPDQAHATNEWCSIRRLHESVEIYHEVATAWCDAGGPAALGDGGAGGGGGG
ncbi:M20 family metallopeptidase [Streptomyces sp. NBRC 109706]|uniref:M20 family metallopeptidase n=1 Tax=Streptomyces sp. NBRC 109706 TaxID=1550035 RepID=UPI00078297DC|nr:M20 family metallopeptidase [Streptomyces sp. NBRC 109706]